MVIFAACASSLFMMAFGVWYLVQVRRGKESTLSMWIIFLVGVVLSFITCVTEDREIQLGMILNATDVIMLLTVVIGTLIIKRGRIQAAFEKFERKFLLLAFVIVVFWILSGNAFVSNLLVQILIMTGYIPTTEHMIRAKKNTESYTAWFLSLAGGLAALYPAIASGSTLAIIYTARSVVCVSYMIILMTYFELRTRRARRPSPCP